MKILRNLKRNYQWHIISVIGLSASFACAILVFLFARQELSYDKFHAKSDRIYRVTLESNNGETSMHPARVAGTWTKELMAEYPAVENMVRLVPFKKAIVKIGDKFFYSNQAFSTDSSFFSLFDFRVLAGNPQKAFIQPGRAFISKGIALKYFGSIDVVGKEIAISHQQDPNANTYTIEGVMDDFPVNSHFHAEILTSFTALPDRTTWAYTYYLMKPATDVGHLRSTIQQKWEEDKEPNTTIATLHLQKLTDIHLFSHKTREIEPNGNVRSIILLLSGGLIIIFIALMNHLNLTRVQFVAGIKTVKVKLINGASRWAVAAEFATEAAAIALISVMAGILVALNLSETLGLTMLGFGNWFSIALLSVSFILTVLLVAVIPVFGLKMVSNTQLIGSNARLYTFPLVVQFVLAIITVVGTIVLNRQMNFLNYQHPQAANADILVIPNNQQEVVQRYETLKVELVKSPTVIGVTSAMEEPGGDILDHFQFEMEGFDNSTEKSINILTTDSDFFPFLGIEPLAGSVKLGYVPSQQWEAAAIELSMLQNMGATNNSRTKELTETVGSYSEQYILNRSALAMMGITNPEDAIGRKFQLKFHLSQMFPPGTIVGVVPDFHYTNLYMAERPLVIAPRKMFSSTFLVRIDSQNRKQAIADVSAAWQRVNPSFPLEYDYLTNTYQKVYASEYAQTRVVSLFALISIVISLLGIYAMASFSMQQRVKEIGIRKINGANISEIMFMLNRSFVKWVGVAFVIATPIAYYAMTKWLQNFAYKTTLSWWIFALAGLLALLIALLTVSWQSWRAASRNPVEALRYE
ncbi:MAG: ABC transporter permease [Bacteroidales bacterium]|nr:ABC transporter permease [Bacteroidales bacterium]